VVKSRKNDEAARLLEDGITTVAMNVFVVGGDLSPTFHPHRAQQTLAACTSSPSRMVLRLLKIRMSGINPLLQNHRQVPNTKGRACCRPFEVNSGVFQMRRYWLRTLNRAVQVGEGELSRKAFRSGRTCTRTRKRQPLGGALRLKGIEPVGARPRRLEAILFRLGGFAICL